MRAIHADTLWRNAAGARRPNHDIFQRLPSLHARRLPPLLSSPCHIALSTHSKAGHQYQLPLEPTMGKRNTCIRTFAATANLNAPSISDCATLTSCSTLPPHCSIVSRLRSTCWILFRIDSLDPIRSPIRSGVAIWEFLENAGVYVRPSAGAALHAWLGYVLAVDVTDEGDVPPPPLWYITLSSPPLKLYLLQAS